MRRDLYSAPEGRRLRVVSVPGLKILRSLGIYPGAVVVKIRRCALGGPALVRVATRQVALGQDVARGIWVREADGDGTGPSYGD